MENDHVIPSLYCTPQVWCGLTITGELIAVKQLQVQADLADADEEYEKICQEVNILHSLNHKNIVGYVQTVWP